MGKVVIKILQGSAVMLTMLRKLTICPPVANFLQCIPGIAYVPKIVKIGWQGTTGVSCALLVYMQNCQPTLLVFNLLKVKLVDLFKPWSF